MKKKDFVLIALVVVILFGLYLKANVLTIHALTGEFYHSAEATDQNGNVDMYYHFEADDGSALWALTERQMGFVPKTNVKYKLTYDDNGSDDTCDYEFVKIKEVK